MQNISKKVSNQTSVHSMSPSAGNGTSWWHPSGSQNPQSSPPSCRNLYLDSPRKKNLKQIDNKLQDQESSSSQSTGQSHQELATSVAGHLHGKSGSNGSSGSQAGGHMKPALSLGTSDTVFPQQVEYGQPMARIPYPHATPYFGGMWAAYGPQAIMHPQIVGTTSARVALPLDPPEVGPGPEPVYVNAKQYRAILKRRESRAKLEAENKVTKDRKPYLHESRHLHALKRVRGSGGRFVNTKKMEESNDQNASNVGFLQRGRESRTGTEHLQSEVSNACASATSCSDGSSVSAGDGDLLRQSDFRFMGYPPQEWDGSHHRFRVVR
ncbi:hypothetical protein GIB67_006011 [Kingdonia uniflora]|uniref:Nuclear transcription factor Y subunit n=1 Tax=Kingdonia uniflora TaxID=39325 RepID=A0A7J7MBV1_9MAGN|nr:hypothetical protein GIB67_006011 [Kingdonia uniflora]